jgi:two-component system OmpR family response regulator
VVIDDYEGVREVVREILVDHGYLVSTGAEGSGFRAILETTAVDLAIIDAILPGESGLSLAEHACNRGIGVILMTGHPDLVPSARLAGVRLLRKPFRIVEFVDLVRASLAAGATQDPTERPGR